MITRRRLAYAFPVLLLLMGTAAAQAPPSAGDARKQATATRLSGAGISIDGRLNEEIWLRATPVTDVLQKEPTEGAPPTDVMDVRFVYDENALYIGARMDARNARGI